MQYLPYGRASGSYTAINIYHSRCYIFQDKRHQDAAASSSRPAARETCLSMRASLTWRDHLQGKLAVVVTDERHVPKHGPVIANVARVAEVKHTMNLDMCSSRLDIIHTWKYL